jgi:hypothetical protein
MGAKPHDWFTTPLCHRCHTKQHGVKERAFWAALDIDPIRIGMALYLASDHEAREQIIEANSRREEW